MTDKMVQDIIDGKLKLGDKNYYTDFTKRQINDFDKKYSTRFIRGLRFKHEDINHDIKKIINGSIGIHARRGRGVRIHRDNTINLDLFQGWNHDILSEYVRMKVKDMPAWKFYQFDFVTDDVYFEKIDLILEENPNQKFYISHDLKEVHTKNFLDLYCLCNTREIFKTHLSTWSDLACDYNNKRGIYIQWDSDVEILEKCIKKIL